ERQLLVLNEMHELGFISDEELDATPLPSYRSTIDNQEFFAPHFSVWIRDYLYELYGEDRVVRSGFTVTTTLDLNLQQTAERLISNRIAALRGSNVTNGGLVSIN